MNKLIPKIDNFQEVMRTKMKYFLQILIGLLLLNSCQQKQEVVKEEPKSLSINFAAGLEEEDGKPKLVGISWDAEEAIYIGSGTYSKLVGYKNKILCFYENNGVISMVKGSGDAKEWGEPKKVAEYKDGAAITPGPLVLKNGDIICFYVDSPLEDYKDYFRVMMTRSTDEGESWSAPKRLFQAGNNFKAGCWEPAACQVKSGEIYLFFSNELPYGDSNEQEVTMLMSTDGAKQWSKPEKLVFKKSRRTGAPAVMTLPDGNGMLLLVDEGPEENTAEKQKPVMLFSAIEDKWERPLTVHNDTRWDPFIRSLDKETFAASPSLGRLSTGETVMSVSYNEHNRKEPTIAVFLGDPTGKFFTYKTEPFDIPSEVKAHWSSVYVLGGDKVAVAATTTLKKKSGIWLKLGSLEFK
ncbi:MAG: glycoside hydrolase [Lentisphaeraceae bacterium]|nr:glycoside hydrolase [Lentisphaeraceae bacterium]